MLGLKQPVTRVMLDEWREETAFSPKIRAVFGLLERITTEPDAVSADDVEAVRAAGITDDAIVDALYVAFMFNLINRLVNAFGCSWATEEERLQLAQGLHRLGYRAPEFLLR